MNTKLLDLVHSAPIFSLLSKEELSDVIPHLKKIKLNEGDLLFKKNDPGDSLYLVVDGLLGVLVVTSTKGTHIAGKIKKGQVVGEMGLLSQSPRSATTVALYSSVVLQLDIINFKKYFSVNAEKFLEVSKLIINRNVKIKKILENTDEVTSAFIFPVNQELNFNFIIHILQKLSNENYFKVAFIKLSFLRNMLNKEHSIESYIREIKLKNNFTIFVADIEDEYLFNFAASHSDYFNIVASGDQPKNISPFILANLDSYFFSLAKKNLILIYNYKKLAKYTNDWLKSYNFNNVHHISYKSTEDEKKLLRFLTNRSIGLVLSGGGMRSWAHVGAIKALLELNIPIDCIGGVSAGAIAGSVFAVSSGYDDFVEKFDKVLHSSVSPFSFGNFTYPVVSLLSSEKETNALMRLFERNKIEDLPILFYCLTCNLNTMKVTTHSEGLIWKWIRASCAIPGLVPPVVDDGDMYVDGGLLNNLPVDVMRNKLGSSAKIIAINLSPVSVSTKKYNFPPIITKKKSILIKLGFLKYKKYKIPSYPNLILKSLLLGSNSTVNLNINHADYYLAPDLSKFHMISKLSKKHKDEMIDIGYNEVMAISDQLIKYIKNV
ncbi:patatin-like phospholipase family protein [Gammaproteobacteria bacterium]|nr:patatin-like phospholipase family protein [Gammaproteobacteria bacterium]